MICWLITTGEIIPLGQERPNRTGILSQRLAAAGHEVVWWTTTFDHQHKRFLYPSSREVVGPAGMRLIYLHGRRAYSSNVSVDRLVNHAQVAASFRQLATGQPMPDVIFCSFPTIDLADEAVRYGRQHKVPVVIDVRDLWPDIFIDPFPRVMRPLVRLGLAGYVRKTRRSLAACSAITAVSQGYLDWGLKYAGRHQSTLDQVFPLGYDRGDATSLTASERQAFFKEYGLDPSKVIVWFVGTFGRTYALGTVLQVARLLADQGRDDVQFVFTGDGERGPTWLSMAEGLSNCVFTGWVDKHRLQAVSDVAAVGLMAYSAGAPQGLPNKLFEYLAAGLPIVSSLSGETEALLAEQAVGLTYQADDSAHLMACLLALVDDPAARKAMGQRGKALFEREFSASVVYDRLLTYVESMRKSLA